jgi:Cys-rich protein (TIGR01571 family)
MNQLWVMTTLPWFISANDSIHTSKCPEGYTECLDFCDSDHDCRLDHWCANETRREMDTCIIPFYNRTNNIPYEKEEYLWLLVELIFWSILLSISLALTTCVCRVVGPRQRFSTPLHACFDDIGTCCLVTLCPCIQWARIVEWSIDDQSPWWCFCLAYFFCGDFRICLGMVTRPAVRNKIGIQGEFWEDCLIHCFAHSCALCQEARELKVDSYGIPQINPISTSHHNIQPVVVVPSYPIAPQSNELRLIKSDNTNSLEVDLI